MFKDMEALSNEIEKFKDNIKGVDTIADGLKSICLNLEVQNKKVEELMKKAASIQENLNESYSPIALELGNLKKMNSTNANSLEQLRVETTQLIEQQKVDTIQKIDKLGERSKLFNHKFTNSVRVIYIVLGIIGIITVVGLFT